MKSNLLQTVAFFSQVFTVLDDGAYVSFPSLNDSKEPHVITWISRRILSRKLFQLNLN